MKISLNGIGKKYRKQWVFRDISQQLVSGKSYSITGANGSGKSTLLKIISGYLLPATGQVSHYLDNKKIDEVEVHQHISMAAPYLELPEEFTLKEIIAFHVRFKQLLPGLRANDLPALWQLENAENKHIREFSTGMKQRLKVGLALYTDSQTVLLDEPASNLDKKGVNWYLDTVRKMAQDRLLVVCSNREDEFQFCSDNISIEDYK